MATTKKQEANLYRQIENELQKPGNKTCADCDAKGGCGSASFSFTFIWHMIAPLSCSVRGSAGKQRAKIRTFNLFLRLVPLPSPRLGLQKPGERG